MVPAHLRHMTWTVMMLACWACLSSCSWFSSSSTSESMPPQTQTVIPNSNSAIPVVSLATQKVNPFSFEIDEEVNDGKVLHVRGHVSSQANIQKVGTAIRVTGLREGVMHYRRDYPVSELLSENSDSADSFEIDRAYPFELSLPLSSDHAPDPITDYQLELVWGQNVTDQESARAAVAATDSHPVPGTEPSNRVEFRNARIEQSAAVCPAPPCGLLIKVTGDLTNRGTQSVRKVILAVGFSAGSGETNSEELVTMDGLNLSSGEAKTVRLVFERPIPNALAQILHPLVRVTQVE